MDPEAEADQHESPQATSPGEQALKLMRDAAENFGSDIDVLPSSRQALTDGFGDSSVMALPELTGLSPWFFVAAFGVDADRLHAAAQHRRQVLTGIRI